MVGTSAACVNQTCWKDNFLVTSFTECLDRVLSSGNIQESDLEKNKTEMGFRLETIFCLSPRGVRVCRLEIFESVDVYAN